MIGKTWKLLLKIIFLIASIEILSFTAHYFHLETIAFLIIMAILFILSLKKLEYGLYAALLELFIGSQGRLLSVDIGGFSLSLRMGIFIIVMSVWLVFLLKEKKLLDLKKIILKNKILFALIAVIIWGGVFALLRGIYLGNIFFDANAWLYFAYIFPMATHLRKENLPVIFNLLFAGIIALAVKTFFYVYSYIHEFPFTDILYKWGRDTRWGEFTHITDNLYRIFSQSHIFALLGFFLIIGILTFKDKIFSKQNIFWLVSLCASLSVVLIDLSRSFWVAGIGTIIAALCWFLSQKDFSRLFNFLKILLFGAASSYIFILIIFNIPLTKNFISGAELFSSRVQSGEAGASSRKSQLLPLVNGIAKHPIIGSGWGTSLTYNSQDPRIKNANNPQGILTTTAFEWGYLDLTLKVGLVGLLIYLYWLFNLIKTSIVLYKKNSDQRATLLGLNLGLIALAGTHMFSPYLNHPLGIGFLLIVTTYLNSFTQESNRQTSDIR